MKTQAVSHSSPKRMRILVLILTILSTYALIATAGIELLPAFLPGLQSDSAQGMSGGLSPILVNFPLPITGWVATVLVVAPWIALGLLFIALLLEIARRTALGNSIPQASAGTPATSQSNRSSNWWIGALCAMMLVALIAGINIPNTAWAVAQNDPGETMLRRVAMVSATEGWAVGGTEVGSKYFGVIWHYTHGKWQRDPTTLVREQLYGITTLPNGDAWAVGGGATILHEHSGTWTMMPLARGLDNYAYLYDNIYSIAMISPTEGWAVGGPSSSEDNFLLSSGGNSGSGGGRLSNAAYPLTKSGYSAPPVEQGANPRDSGWYGCLILHYTGGQWSRVDCPGSGDFSALESISVLPNGDAWAVGKEGLMMHEHNGAWTSIDLSPKDDFSFTASQIVMTSPTEGWVLRDGRMLHYQRGKLTEVSIAKSDTFGLIIYNFALSSPTEGWAVGDGGFLHYTHGVWKLIPRSQNNFSELVRGVALVPGHPNETWAVGYNDGQPLFLYRNGETWSRYSV